MTVTKCVCSLFNFKKTVKKMKGVMGETKERTSIAVVLNLFSVMYPL